MHIHKRKEDNDEQAIDYSLQASPLLGGKNAKEIQVSRFVP